MSRIPLLLACGLLLVLALVSPAEVAAQETMLTAQDQPVQVSLTPAYQRFETNSQTATQWSTTLTWRIPLGDRVRVLGQAQAARSDSEIGAAVQGMDDARLGLVYAQPVGRGSLVGRVDVGVPVGKSALAVEELQTVRLTSWSFADFRVPGFGTGASVVPRLSYATPLGDRFVVGLGAAYQFLGSYRPVENASRSYDPGDGVEVFGGFDAQLSRTSAVALDLRYSRFGTARSGRIDRLEPGTSFGGTVQYRYETDRQAVRVEASYQNWDESSVQPYVVGPDAAASLSRQQLVPSRLRIHTSYQQRLGDRVVLRGRLGGAYYWATDLNDRKRVGVLTLRPAFRLSSAWTLTPIAQVAAGDLFGLTGGLRLGLQL